MACKCETYTCVEARLNPCSEGMQLDYEATETGNWKGVLYFQDTSTEFAFGVTAGDPIVVPTELFNENYTHELRVYNTAGDLEVCLHVKTIIDQNAGNYPVIPIVPSGLGGKEYNGNDLDTQVFPELNGRTLLTISMGGQEYTSDFFTQSGTSVTWLVEGMLFTGKIVLTWQ